MSGQAKRALGQRLVFALPYAWLIVFFLVPFLIVLKISFSQSAIALPPYTPVLDLAAGWRGMENFVAGLSLVVGLIEIGSMLGSPEHPTLFGRPFAASPPNWTLTSDQVNAQLAAIKRCPASQAYSGQPFLAFAADRRMPGNQPDQFIIGHARVDARFLAAAARDKPRCP